MPRPDIKKKGGGRKKWGNSRRSPKWDILKGRTWLLGNTVKKNKFASKNKDGPTEKGQKHRMQKQGSVEK